MSRLSFRFAAPFLLALALALAGAATASAAPEIRRVVSEKGIVAWLVHDPTVPVIAVDFAFEGGAALDPLGREGLADMASALLDEGAGELDANAFQRRLEDLAVSLAFKASHDRFNGSLKTLRENREAAFELLGRALSAPRFDGGAVARIRTQLLSRLARLAEDPTDLAYRRFFAAVFEGDPYARPTEGTAESVAAITRADLKAFVKRRLSRRDLAIGVAGDITEAELRPLLDAAFGDLPDSAGPGGLAPAMPASSGRRIVVEKAIPQSVAVFGQPGVKRDDPDYYAALVMNAILGGSGFGSRLNEEVREKRGLAYSVYSGLLPLDRAGLIVGGVATRNAGIAESLRLVRREWQRMHEGEVDAPEVEDAKRYLTGSFPLTLDGTDRIASVLVAIQLHDLGIDYLERRRSLIEAVTVEDVRRVAKRLLDAKGLTVVIVGAPVGERAGAK
jgi:zinc protease